MKKQYEIVVGGYMTVRAHDQQIDGVIWSETTAPASRDEVANQIRAWRSRGLTVDRSGSELRAKKFPTVFYRQEYVAAPL